MVHSNNEFEFESIIYSISTPASICRNETIRYLYVICCALTYNYGMYILSWHLFTGKSNLAEHSKTDAVAYIVAIAVLTSMLMPGL